MARSTLNAGGPDLFGKPGRVVAADRMVVGDRAACGTRWRRDSPPSPVAIARPRLRSDGQSP